MLEVGSVVFCEAIRQEAGGKHILLGVTAPEVNVANIPALIPLAIWLAVKPNETGKFDIGIRILDVQKIAIIEGKLHGEFKDKSQVALAFGPFPIEVNEPGNFDFEWNLNGEGWKKIATYRVNFAPATT
jgi:hypothetical protein